jgi:predicted amidohydrolase
LIVLPEMFHTAFSMKAKDLAENLTDSKGLNWLKAKAHEKQTAIYTSMIVEEKGKFFNRGLFVKPTGEISEYNKIQLFSLAGENEVYTPGGKKTIVEYKGWKICLQICYDLRFPEISRNKIQASNQKPLYDVLVYVANWPSRRDVHWRTLLQARAIENQAYVLGVNRVGTDGNGLTYTGSSMCVTALGEITDVSLPEVEGVKQIELKMNELEDIRIKIPFLKDQTC